MLFKSLISSVSNVSSNSSSYCINNNASLSLFDENTLSNRSINKTTFFTRPNYISM